MQMPRPGPGHLQLERFAGSWEGEETMHPSQWDPQGGTAIGRTRGVRSLAGFATIVDYEQERDGEVTFSGHGVYTYDSTNERIVLHWFDCMGSPPEIFTGRFDGDVIVMAHGGPGMHARMTYDLREKDVMLSKMEMSADGRSWMRLFDGVYRRRPG